MAGNKPFSVVFSPEAEEDIERIVERLVENKTAQASLFSEDLRRVRRFLETNPFLYQDYFLFIKRAPLRRSGYNLFYAVDDVNAEVEIIAIFHQKESHDHLRERLNI